MLLAGGSLDTSRPETQRARKAAGAFPGRRLHLVQFAGPVLPAWREPLLNAGVQIVCYIPYNAYLVYGDATALARVQSPALAAIQWEGAYLDEYKTNAAARPAKANQFAIQLVADAAANAATLQLLDPAARRHRVLNYLNVIAPLQPAELRPTGGAAGCGFDPAVVAARKTVRAAGPDRGGEFFRHGAKRAGISGMAGGQGIHPGAIRGLGFCRGPERQRH